MPLNFFPSAFVPSVVTVRVLPSAETVLLPLENTFPPFGVWVGMADGKANKTKGNLAWDAAAYKVVNDHTYGITTMKGEKVRTTGTSTVSADGKTRTVATEGTDADGKKFKSKAVFDKK